MSFQSYLAEDINTEAEELKTKLPELFFKYFPKGWFEFSKPALGGDDLYFKFGIFPKDKLPNNIRENDRMFHIFTIRVNSLGFETERYVGTGVTGKPTSKYYAQETVKVSYRKTKGDSKKIMKNLETYFQRLHKTVKDNPDKWFEPLEDYIK